MKLGFKKKLLSSLEVIGEIALLSKETFKAIFTRPFYFHRLVEQFCILGINSIPITIVIGLVAGLVMALEFGFGLAKFGGTLYVPGVVSLSITREIAPVFTSLLLAGRIGSGITAEIGAMNVSQQIDAIRALGTSPIRVLVVPRLLATLIALPLLTILADTMGLIGSFFISKYEFNMTLGFYINKVLNHLNYNDFFSGLLKTFFFAFIITTVACYKGLNTKQGTKGVGDSATWVVVNSSIAILVCDFFLTKLFVVIMN
ncbi:MAG: ABC transporter permease [Bacteriovoracaceae bacterium]|nr:ABC transporter permease [Bacteriovoracaceae bacterium]